MDPVPDGILGDKIMKSRAKSKVLERVSKEDVLRDQFTIAELNDLNNYLAWNIWDVLVMRATEGVSGMIPRQEYEILAFMHEFYRWPEILGMTMDEVGAQGIVDIGASARREIGTKVNCVHDWCIGAVGFGMGRCGLLALEAIKPYDYIEESNTILKFMQRVLWDSLGTAVTVQAMVFGNRDGASGSGVAFSCNPNTGERGLFGEYITGRQGEDLVAGTATPVDLAQPGGLDASLRAALVEHGQTLESLYRDAVDIEFTVEANALYLLQVRPAKRTAEAAVRVAVDLLRAGTISREEAVRRVTPQQLGKLLRPAFDAAALDGAHVLARGIGSSPGHAAGIAVLDADDAAERAAAGARVILLRPTTSPQDIRGMLVAEGIVTARGGALSHAAVVSRALDKPCIVGCDAIDVDVANRTFTVDGRTYAEGTPLSIDGDSGAIYFGALPLRPVATGRAELADLVAAAGEISGAQVAAAVVDFTDISRAVAGGGAVVAGLTDLLIAAGNIDRLTSAIGALAGDAGRGAYEAEIETLARDVTARALDACAHATLALRLPSFLSDRARQIVPTWAALPARSLLPLGEPRFYAPMARGVGAAAEGRAGLLLLLTGVTEIGEIAAFRAAAAGPGLLDAGAFVRSFAGLHNFARGADVNGEVWVDIDAVVRSAYGFPSELMAARGVFADYRERGLLAEDPQVQLAPFLQEPLRALLERIGPQLACAVCGAGLDGEMATALYELGYRRFAVPTNDREAVCLRLARVAIGVEP